MTIENEVPKLEICKRLKELGYPQEGAGFYWVTTRDGLTSLLTRPEISPNWDSPVIVAAPMIGEMGERLPSSFYIFYDDWLQNKKHTYGTYRLTIQRSGDKGQYWLVEYNLEGERTCISVGADTEADTRGNMLIYLLENNLLKFDGKGKS